jgi:hypothetical protein
VGLIAGVVWIGVAEVEEILVELLDLELDELLTFELHRS